MGLRVFKYKLLVRSIGAGEKNREGANGLFAQPGPLLPRTGAQISLFGPVGPQKTWASFIGR